MNRGASELGPEVKSLILRCAGSSWRLEDFDEDLPIAEGGIGLDSVKLVELVCMCEDHFGVRLPLESLARQTLTVGTLVRGIADAGLPGASSRPTEERAG